MYQQYGLPPPRPRTPVPRLLVYQRKSANRRVLNEPAFLDLLASYGELRVVEFDASSSLHEQLLAVAAAGVFVSVHTSNLANAPLLQPGSAVVEIIQVRVCVHVCVRSPLPIDRSIDLSIHQARRCRPRDVRLIPRLGPACAIKTSVCNQDHSLRCHRAQRRHGRRSTRHVRHALRTPLTPDALLPPYANNFYIHSVLTLTCTIPPLTNPNSHIVSHIT